MISLILLLAVVIGLGLRLVRWVECLPDTSADVPRSAAERPAKADAPPRVPAGMFGSVL